MLALAVILGTASGACGAPEGAPPADTTPIEVLSFNVLCSFCSSPDFDPWATRLPEIHAAITRINPDLMGLQELFMEEEVDDILYTHPEYETFYYIDPAPGASPFSAYPDAAIFWRKDRFDQVNSGEYWLSPKPDEAWSAGFANGQIWRLLVWVELVQKSDGRHLIFATTHFDNNSPSQEMSAPLTVTRTGGQAEQLPVILVGDFNSTPSSTAYQTLIEGFVDSYPRSAQVERVSVEATAPAWDPMERIDHIFFRGPGAASPDTDQTFTVSKSRIDLTRYADPPRFPSDHWPIAATLSWPEQK